MIVAVPAFSARCNLQRFHKRIEVMQGDGEGIYEALSADAGLTLGASWRRLLADLPDAP